MEHTVSGTLAGKYLTFALGDEEYGLPVLQVREIIKVMEITQVPQVPAHVRGVINLRGRVVPVIDLRLKFGLPPREYSERTCIVVVDVTSARGSAVMGVIVDRVAEVVHVAATEIDPTPHFGEDVNTDCVLGLARVKGSVKILLALDQVLDADGQFSARAS
jgi:purine-binding chemotaxis protein CheW